MIQLPALSMLGAVFVPASVALTGLFYLAGWSERNALLKNFGLSSGLFDEPFQSTLARGYLPVFLGASVIAAFALIGWVVVGAEKYFRRRIPRYPTEWLNRAMTIAWKFNRWFYTFYFCVLVLMLGLLSGEMTGDLKARRVWDALDRGCVSKERLNCARYDVGGKSYTGVLLVQDGARAAVATKTGVRLFANDRIDNVTPLGPRRPSLQQAIRDDLPTIPFLADVSLRSTSSQKRTD